MSRNSKKFFWEITEGEIEESMSDIIQFDPDDKLTSKDFRMWINNGFLDRNERYNGFATPASILLIDGHTKTRKTSFIKMMVAAHLSRSGVYENIKSTFDINQYVLWFDTEQMEGEFRDTISNTIFISGRERKPENFLAFNLKNLTPEQRINAIIYNINKTIQKHTRNGHIDQRDKIAMIIIDQIADLVNDINDNKEVRDIIHFLNYIIKITGALIPIVIHKNKNNTQATGVIGYEIKKKASVYLSASKKKDSDNEADSMIYLNEARIPVIFKRFYLNYKDDYPIVL